MLPAVLFTRANSVYLGMGLDCYDAVRDARTFKGSQPIVAHPPCRSWGRLHRFAKAPPEEKELGLFAVDVVRSNGGVIEHPAWSALWPAANLPPPQVRAHDRFGGYTLPVYQSWWGHRAPKPTWLYIVGVRPCDLPPMPFYLGIPTGRIQDMGKAEREATPVAFARWLVDVAGRAH